MSPKTSDETEVVMSILRRWAWTALALPSRSEETVKAWSCTRPSLTGGGPAAAGVRLISRTAVWPAATVNESVAGG